MSHSETKLTGNTASSVPSLVDLKKQYILEGRFAELPHAARAMVWFYFGIGCLHPFFVPGDVRWTLAAISIASSFACFLVLRYLRSNETLSHQLILVLQLLLCAIASINVYFHLYLTGDLHQSSNILMIYMLLAYMRLPKVPFFAAVLSIFLIWVLIIVGFGDFDPDLAIHYAFSIIFAGVICSVIRLAQLYLADKSMVELKARLEAEAELSVANSLLKHQAEHDPLTGLANRRRLSMWLDDYKEKQGNLQDITVMFCDVDHFKRYNDQYGHLKGDKALLTISGIISSVSQQYDGLAARLGGDEFGLLLPKVDLASAQAIAADICSAVRDKTQDKNPITVTVGSYSNVNSNDFNEKGLFSRADEALYEAKGAGRNGFVCR